MAARSPTQGLAIGLHARTREVLLAVLREYVETAQPVASGSIARRLHRRVSSATVRAVMAELGELGLLFQPYTSAGRVPTERAFRLYADAILDQPVRDAVLTGEGLGADRTLDEGSHATDELLRRAANLLSQATGQLGFFIAAQPDRMLLRRLVFVRVSSERVMAILVSERGVVQTRLLDESESDQRILDQISERVTGFVAGFSLAEARARLAAAVEREREIGGALWRKALVLGEEGLIPTQSGELYVTDRQPLLSQPEFADVDRLREVMAALEEKERMLQLLDRILQADVLQVVIGSEIDDPGIHDCAVVSAPFGESPPLGGLGVIGPVRMPYEQVIPLVWSLSERVSHYLS